MLRRLSEADGRPGGCARRTRCCAAGASGALNAADMDSLCHRSLSGCTHALCAERTSAQQLEWCQHTWCCPTQMRAMSWGRATAAVERHSLADSREGAQQRTSLSRHCITGGLTRMKGGSKSGYRRGSRQSIVKSRTSGAPLSLSFSSSSCAVASRACSRP